MQNGHKPPLQTKRRRWLSRKKLLLVVLAAVALGVCIFACVVVQQVGEAYQACYDEWAAADIVIQHMEYHDGSWPKNWEDLREAHEVCAGHRYVPCFDELKRRIAIRFDANPAELVKASESDGRPPFKVIWLRSGKQGCIAGQEPNGAILRYLKERAARPTNYIYPKRPDPREKKTRKALTELGVFWSLDDSGHIAVVRMQRPECTDAAMAQVRGLKELKELDLGYSSITDAGLNSLETLPNLQSLDLHGSKVTDTGLQELRHTPKLETLVLSPLNADSGLQYLAKLGSLRILNLNSTKVTDQGLVQLYGLRNLQEVMLYSTNVTDEGVRKLRVAIPGCKIER